jgi:FkbM family methyltransferase
VSLPAYITGDRPTLERVSREWTQALPVADQAILCRVLGRYIVYCDASDMALTPHLCFDGYWESWVTIALARVLQPGWRCVDVGANHGYYSVIMADGVGPGGRVAAVEPVPRLARLIGRTLEVNGLAERTRVVMQAASDRDADTVSLFVPEANAAMTSSSPPEKWAQDGAEIQAGTITIDTLTHDWPSVDLVKIDAEGAEDRIWRGMLRTLEKNPNAVIILEVHPDRGYDAPAFLHEIQAAGFPLRCIDAHGSVTRTTVEEAAGPGSRDRLLFLSRES